MTKKSRSDRFLEDVVDKGLPADAKKRSNSDSMADFRIPKRSRRDEDSIDEQSTGAASDNAEKASGTEEDGMDDPLNHLDFNGIDLPTGSTPQFKPLAVRVSRLPAAADNSFSTFNATSKANRSSFASTAYKKTFAQPLGKPRSSFPAGRTTATSNQNQPQHLNTSADSVSCMDDFSNPILPVPSAPKSRVDQDDRPYRNASPQKEQANDSADHHIFGHASAQQVDSESMFTLQVENY